MSHCANCGTPFGEAEIITDNETIVWTNVARIVSVAEAGYLANRLLEQEIAARVVEVPSFSAIGGEWSHGYVLQVDSQQHQTAIDLLQAEAEESNGEAEWDESAGDSESANSLPALRVMGLLALAGVAGFWAGTHNPQLPTAGRTTAAERLATQIDSAGKPLEARSPDDGSVHRIWFDRQRQAIVYERDAGGQGNWQQQRLFPLTELR